MPDKSVLINSIKSGCRKVCAAEIKLRVTVAVVSHIHGIEAERCLNAILRTRVSMSCTGLPQCIEVWDGFGFGGGEGGWQICEDK